MKKTHRSGNFFIEVSSLLLIFLFVYAAAGKFTDFQKFRVQLGQSPLLTSMAGFVAWFIPLLEIGIAILLSMPRRRLTGLYASFTLMVAFTAYIVAITRFSDYIPCSCGGIISLLNWNQHLLFNLVFVLLALISIIIYPEPENQRQPVQHILLQ